MEKSEEVDSKEKNKYEKVHGKVWKSKESVKNLRKSLEK